MITLQELRPAPSTTNPLIKPLLFDQAYLPGTVISYILQGTPGDTGTSGGAVWATDGRAAAFANALQAWANVANISFTQLTQAYDGTTPIADVDWAESFQTLEEGVLAQHHLPFAGLMEGEYNLDAGIFTAAGLAEGGLGYATFVHEIGHGLGLLHPHENAPGPDAFPGVVWPWDTGYLGLNQGIFTTMSYNDGYEEVGLPETDNFGLQSTPGAFDIASVQLLYGANTTYNTGNQLYALPQVNAIGTSWKTIWDAGGTDTLTAEGSSAEAFIDLRAATLLMEPGGGGFVSRVAGILGGFTIANGVVIENATGGNGDDWFIGNAGNNTLIGGNGFDMVDFSHLTTALTVNLAVGTAAGEGSDTLMGIEGVRGGSGNDTLRASDQQVAVRAVDVVLDRQDPFSGDDQSRAIALDGLFGSAPATGSANGNAVATISATGRDRSDWFKFTLASGTVGQQIVLDIDNSFDLDAMVQLLDKDGNVLKSNNDMAGALDPGSATRQDSLLTYSLPGSFASPQTFYIHVGSYSSSGPGGISSPSSYTLHVAAPVAATAGPAYRSVLYGMAGDDVLTGGTGNALLDGGAGNDTLTGGAGVDMLIGGLGNDILYGSAGIDTLVGGEGNDTYYLLTADALDDVIVELQGSSPGTEDTVVVGGSYVLNVAHVEIAQLDASAGASNLTGNDGQNTLKGNDAANSLFGLGGQDALWGGGGVDYLYGGRGEDSYYFSDNQDLAFEDYNDGEIDGISSPGDQYLYANVENLVIVSGYGVGNELDNRIMGGTGQNLLLGGAGQDTIFGGQGNDVIYGESGGDTLVGNEGVDFIAGGSGNDVLIGVEGADALYGEDGDDMLASDSQITWDVYSYYPYGASVPRLPAPQFVTDILVGGAGNDVLYGNSGLGDYDLLYGNTGDDRFYVDTPDDLVFEQLNEGIDTVYADIVGAGYYLYDNIENLVLVDDTPFGVGNRLDNVLTGSEIGNWLLGGAGNDTINGNGGNDVLFGEAGSDTFVFAPRTGADVIGDFVRGVDKIDLSAFDFTTFAQVSALFVQDGAVGAIILGLEELVVLHNVQMSTLTAADFIL